MSSTLAARMAALADELEADPGHDDGYMAAAGRIRDALAADGPQAVWTVANDEYEDQSIIAVFTTEELANEFAAKQTGSTSIYGEPLLDRIPEQVTVHVCSAHLHADGRVFPGPGWTQAMWDFEADLGISEQMTLQGTQFAQARQLTEADAVRLLGEHVEQMLAAQAERVERNGDWLARVVTEMWESLTGKREPRLTTQLVCYDASFGRVHVRSSCRCPR